MSTIRKCYIFTLLIFTKANAITVSNTSNFTGYVVSLWRRVVSKRKRIALWIVALALWFANSNFYCCVSNRVIAIRYLYRNFVCARLSSSRNLGFVGNLNCCISCRNFVIRPRYSAASRSACYRFLYIVFRKTFLQC